MGSKRFAARIGPFEYKAKLARSLACEAIDAEKLYPSTAKYKWRDIYGSKFPS
jgi:hypothetical protein